MTTTSSERPLLLDLFCGVGGAAMGYHRAGFDVVGVDIAPQPDYPFEVHQADAIDYLLGNFDWTNNRASIAEAIPPAYTEYVGAQLMSAIEVAA